MNQPQPMTPERPAVVRPWLLLLLLIVILAGGGYFGWKYYQNQKTATPSSVATMPSKTTSTTTANTSDQDTLCTTEPISTDIGRDEYPVAIKYQNLTFLGQLFTASDCSRERLSKISGVNGENYNLGSLIRLITYPSQDLLNTFESIDFKCQENGVSNSLCLKWELSGTIKVNDLLKLKPYSSEFESDDCVNCG